MQAAYTCVPVVTAAASLVILVWACIHLLVLQALQPAGTDDINTILHTMTAMCTSTASSHGSISSMTTHAISSLHSILQQVH